MTEVNLYNREELHHNCLVQVWHNTYSGKTSYAWRHDTERGDAGFGSTGR